MKGLAQVKPLQEDTEMIMIRATQITLLVVAVFFCLLAMGAKETKAGIVYASSAAGAFVLLLAALKIL